MLGVPSSATPWQQPFWQPMSQSGMLKFVSTEMSLGFDGLAGRLLKTLHQVPYPTIRGSPHPGFPKKLQTCAASQSAGHSQVGCLQRCWCITIGFGEACPGWREDFTCEVFVKQLALGSFTIFMPVVAPVYVARSSLEIVGKCHARRVK